MPGPATNAESEETTTMEPGRLRRCGMLYLAHRNGPRTLTAITASHSSTPTSASGLSGPSEPALATSTSSPPKRSAVACEQQRGRAPDPRTATRDERHAVLQPTCHVTLQPEARTHRIQAASEDV